MTATIALPRPDWLSRLRTIMVLRPGQRHVTLPGVGVDVRGGRNTLHAGGAVDWSTWFDHFWLAKGAVSLAASYLDLVSTSNLSTANAPTFDPSYGWSMNGSSNYLDTGILWGDGTWSVLVSFTDYASGTTFVGVNNGTVLRIHKQGAAARNYNNGVASLSNAVTSHTSGVMGLAGSAAYFNGSSDGTLTGSTGAVAVFSIYIGARNNGGAAGNYVAAKIQAVGIKKATLDATQIADASTAMAAL